MKMSRRELRVLIEAFISGHKGTMRVPDSDPYMDLEPSLRDKFDRETIASDEFNRNLVADLDATLKGAPDLDPDDVLYAQTGDELGQSMRAFDDPRGAYDYETSFHKMVDIYIDRVSKERGYMLDIDVEHLPAQHRFPERGEQSVLRSSSKSDLEAVRDELIKGDHLVVNLKMNSPMHGIVKGISYQPDGTFMLSAFNKKSKRYDMFA